MINFILIAICITAGILLQKNVPVNAYKAINAWLIYLGLPAVSFRYLPHIEFNTALLIPALIPVMVWIIGWIFSTVYSKMNKLDAVSTGCLKLSTGLGNTSFLGFPLVAAYFGDEYIGIAVICDQVTFLLLATAAIVVAIRSSGSHKLSLKTVLVKILSFPAFPACILALVLPRFTDLSMLEPLFDKIAMTVPPLALFSIGLQLRFDQLQNEIKHVTAALLCKLLITPAIIFFIVWISGFNSMEAKVGLFEACMPTLVSSGIVAAEYRLNPKLSSLIIGAGIVISFITTAAWYFVIRSL